MFVESDRRQLPPPSSDELLVVEHVLHQCVHRDRMNTQEYGQFVSTCCVCGDRVTRDLHWHAPPTPDELNAMWLREIPRPATHLIVAMLAVGEIARAGWDVKYQETPQVAVCILRKGERAIRSRPLATRAAAIVDAIARIANNYR
jgi:hypothetical protein